MQEKNYFYLSGFISISIYLAICASFLIYINAPKPKKYDSAKTTVLELELISIKSDKKRGTHDLERIIETQAKEIDTLQTIIEIDRYTEQQLKERKQNENGKKKLDKLLNK